jgi:hypothetical protein
MNRRAHLTAIIVLSAVACNSDKKSAVPTNPTPVSPTLTSLAIQGPPPTVGPGQTAQVTAVGRFSDGSERAVTGEATWTSTQPQIATVDAGMITGRALGRTQIRAMYLFRSAFLTLVVEPAGTFILSGNITEPGPVSVAAAMVTALGEPVNQTIANSNGFYELFGVSGTVTLRVSKSNYLDDIRMLTVTQDQKVDVQIKPIAGPTPVAGIYRMTLTISPSCSIVPDDLKTRTFTAAIGQDAARLKIQLGDANFVPDKFSFNGQVFGNTVTLDWGPYDYYGYYGGQSVQEILPGGQVLGIWGKMVVPADAQTLSGNLAGGFTFRERTGVISRSCSATDSSVVFTRK